MARVMSSANHGDAASFSRTITFVAGGESRTVDLDAPMPVLRGERLVVSLMDLWVATLLPGDFLDLSFEIVVARADGAERSLPTIDALQFASGHIAIDSRELAFEEAAENASVVKIIVHDASTAPSELKLAPAPVAAPVASPRASASSAIARLDRMLPRGFAGTRYGSVSWRFKKDDPGAARAIMMR